MMKTAKKTVAGILAMTMAMSALVSTFAINVSAETDSDALVATASNTDVDVSTIARKNTTIDVTIPNYRMLASPVYSWTGTMTTTVNKPYVTINNIGDSKLIGGKIVIKGVDGNTLEYEFSTDPEDENYNTAFFDGDNKIIIDYASLGGKFSSIKNAYSNTRAGQATDTMYGEDSLDTPAINFISVQPYYAIEGLKSWKKDDVNNYSNLIKATVAQLNGAHSYTVKSVSEDGVTYNEITVLGKGSSDVSAAEAFSDDCANFKTELAPYVKKTEEAFPVDFDKTAEEVWDTYAKSTGQVTDEVPASYTPVAVDGKLITTVQQSGATQKFVKSSYVDSKIITDPTQINATSKSGVPAGLDYTFSGTYLDQFEAIAKALSGTDKDVSIDVSLSAAVTKETDYANDKVQFIALLRYMDENGNSKLAGFRTTSANVEGLTTKLTFAGLENGFQVPGFDTRTNVDARAFPAFEIEISDATSLKKALHTGNAGAPSTAPVWGGNNDNTNNKYTVAVGLGTYYGSDGQIIDSSAVVGKLPAGIDYTIPTETITTINKGYGFKRDVNATLGFQPVLDADAKKVTFYATIQQSGVGVQDDIALVFKSVETDIKSLANGELRLSGTGNASGAALRLAITDADKLKAALAYSNGQGNVTPWTQLAISNTAWTKLGDYVSGADAGVPEDKDVIAKLANAGYAKPTKANYSYKTSETKARTLSIPYYTKGDSAFSSKADFITTYNAVADCLKNLTVVGDAEAQAPATDMTKYGPLSNFGPTANLYSGGKSKCTAKADYKNPDAINPTSFGNASTDMIKENRVFGVFNQAENKWEPQWVDITAWDDYYNAKYNGVDSTSIYTPGVLAEMNDIIGLNKGAVISMHVDPEGFDDDGRSSDVRTWFELNGRCVLRVNGSSSSMYANLVSYDAATSTFSFNWDEISQNRYNDSTIQVRTLEMLASEKIEVDSITISIPDQEAWNAAHNPKPVDPDKDEDTDKDKDEVVSADDKDNEDNVIEIEDGDKTNSDNVDIEAPDDDEDTPPADVIGDDDEDEDKKVTEPNAIPDDLTPSTDADVTQKPVVDVTVTEASTVATENKTPTTGEHGALAVIPVALAGVAAFLKKKLG